MVFVDVDERLGWRWVWWIQMSEFWHSEHTDEVILGVLLPAIIVVMRETRETVILRRRAAALRKERGLGDGGKYLARADVTKVKFSEAMRQSLLRPLVFLIREPIVTFFSLWVALGVSSTCIIKLTSSGECSTPRSQACHTFTPESTSFLRLQWDKYTGVSVSEAFSAWAGTSSRSTSIAARQPSAASRPDSMHRWSQEYSSRQAVSSPDSQPSQVCTGSDPVSD